MYDLLKGMRVVEAASFIAAPSCTLHMAQMGAEVIRIDQLGGGPDFHRWPLSPEGGASLYWEGLNKNKRSVALDLSRPEGRELAVRIITAPGGEAGLFVTNFPVNGFLAYDRLTPHRPDLICARVMGWPDGRQAVDYTVNAALGLPLMTGPMDHPGPVNHVLPAWDLLAGAYGAFCVVSAERARRQTGRGCEIRLPLSDIAIASLGHLGQIGEVQLSGQDRPRMGNGLFGAFGRDFVTRDERRLMIVAITPRQWTGLLAALDLERAVASLEAELGVTFARDEGVRFEHRGRLVPLFEAAFAGRSAQELGPAFEQRGVCWAPLPESARSPRPRPEPFGRQPDADRSRPPRRPIPHARGCGDAADGAAPSFPGLPEPGTRHRAGPGRAARPPVRRDSPAARHAHCRVGSRRVNPQ